MTRRLEEYSTSVYINGFGLHYFKEELTGPEYAGRFVAQLEAAALSFGLILWFSTLTLKPMKFMQ